MTLSSAALCERTRDSEPGCQEMWRRLAAWGVARLDTFEKAHLLREALAHPEVAVRDPDPISNLYAHN